MKTLIFSSLILLVVSVCHGLLLLPYDKVSPSMAAGSKITIPISNDKFIISNCAALGNSYLYTEDNKSTDYSPVAFFKDSTTLELYVPEVSDATKKYFIVVELPLAEAIIKTGSFTITSGTKINVPNVDGCGKTVRFSNKETNISESINKNEAEKSSNNNAPNANNNTPNANNNGQNQNANNNGPNGGNNAPNNGDKPNGQTGDNKSNILTAENTNNVAKGENEENNNGNMVMIACAGTSVVALVVVSGFVVMRRKSYMKGEEDISYSSLNYMGNNGFQDKSYNPVGGLYDNLTNTNDEFDRDYQLKCLNNENPSQVSYPVSLSDGNSGVNMDKTTDIFEPTEDIPVPELPITKHIVEEIVINPEKALRETINSNAVSAVVTTASVALAYNECGDLTIDNSNIAIEKPEVSTIEKSNTTTTSCTSCSSCSCSSCSSCSCSCSGDGSCSCSCSCAESSRITSMNNESSLKLLELNFSTLGDTTRGYSVFVDNDKDKKDSLALTDLDSNRLTTYTETNYDDSRRLTNYTETTGYDDSRRITNYTETTGYDDSRRYTNYTETTGYDDSRRYTNYTETTGYDDSRRLTNYTDYTSYTEGSTYTTDRDSRRFTNYTEGTDYTNRDSRYTDYTEGSSYSSCSCSGSECDCSRRNTQYSEYTSGYTSYTTDSRRYTGSEYTTTDYTDSRRQTYTTDFSSQYSSDFCEAHDASEIEQPSKILPLSTIEPFGDSMSNGSFLDVLQAKQNAIRDSISGLLPTGPIDGKPPKFDLEFVAQKAYETTKPGELNVKVMDVIRIIENLDGGYYMASNSTTGASGKIPAYIISSLL
ncbi:hypothetical protein BCR32DRAFT_268463 [Anaeromyces robustus]|uniref:SH3 domain-containing protein n=1 Tax=Anaeromyces robustus TaxID=1754192 RepID=A0A1Y1X5P8_9FUNG|nr:hypothetical protein BCR32DRAFT_268463 [Anaeromyces robustus]|eukprot:ORX81137.1 hypothetical protein BCR32DRAFT_268463 [Anaeromyces robustus]